MSETRPEYHIEPGFRAVLMDLRRNLLREIGQKRAQIGTINKLLGEPRTEDADAVRNDRSDIRT